MNRVVELPLWLLILILLFAAVTFSSHFLFPSVRWFLRKRAERVVARLNERLPRPIEPFKLARRYDTVQRLTYDAEVLQAVAAHARETGTREDVVLEEARDYAREIVPAFSASVYFGLAIRLARWLSRALYRVRIVHRDPGVQSPPEGATVIYVMNHRSNMDYVLLTYLASSETALSFAMGEWARTLPLRPVLRAIGGYFIRRKSGNDLYRKVLARYVQIATSQGLTQAIFPEGGLSLDGSVQRPKLGLLHYVLQADADREVLFVPVSVNYDRVLEDRVLLRAGQENHRRFRVKLTLVIRNTWKLVRRRFQNKDYRFGHAAVVFGKPMRLADLVAGNRPEKQNRTEAVAKALMRQIAADVPVLPVPLVARVIAAGELDEAEVVRQVVACAQELGEARVYFPDRGLEAGIEEALAGLAIRKVIGRQNGQLSVREPEVINYYAQSIAHLCTPDRSALAEISNKT